MRPLCLHLVLCIEAERWFNKGEVDQKTSKDITFEHKVSHIIGARKTAVLVGTKSSQIFEMSVHLRQ